MSNRWKFALGVAAILVVGSAAVWLELTPHRSAAADYRPGTLGRAVANHCDPDRQGTFSDDDLAAAVTCRDLDAQESMALSTSRLVWLSWLQIAVAIGGALTVVWTVLVALRTMKLTQETLAHQQTATRLQLRPKFQLEPVTIRDEGSGKQISVEFRFKNVGSLTARRLRKGISWRVAPVRSSAADLTMPSLKDSSVTVAPAGAPSGNRIYISASDAALIRSGTHGLQAAYCMIYDDDLGGAYRYGIVKELWGPKLEHDRMPHGFKMNVPELKDRVP